MNAVVSPVPNRDYVVADLSQADFGREPVHMTYKWKEFIGGKKVDKSEAFTAFTWEKTDKAEALRKDAGI